MFNRFTLPFTAALLALLVACGPRDTAQTDAADSVDAAETAVQPQALAPAETRIVEQPAPAPEPVVCASCGVVRSITAVQQAGQRTGIGAVAGAVVGGVIGNQVGGGSGRKIATAAGAIGGAVLGDKIERDRNASQYYEVVIDMEGGGQQFITVPDASTLSVGQQVTVQGGNISPR